MDIKIGCDLVSIKKFQKSLETGGDIFLNKIFTTHELTHTSKLESLAGMFAAKEAVAKALGFKPGDWHKIEIIKNTHGRPKINLPEAGAVGQLNEAEKIISQDVSITHDGEYAMAVAIFIFQ